MQVRRETHSDHDAVRRVVAEAFSGDPGALDAPEVRLVDGLRGDASWLPSMSLVAEDVDGVVIEHVLCTRATVGGRPALGLGPLSVAAARQRCGVGSALVHAVLGVADGAGEAIVVLVGHVGYYPRFGFVPAEGLGIAAPDPTWGAAFQARPLAAHDPSLRGPFFFAGPFDLVN